MQGTITKHKQKTGRVSWGYYFLAGRDVQGKRKQVTKQGFATKREAEDALRQALDKAERGSLQLDPRCFSEVFDVWIKEHCNRNCEPTTVEGYVAKGAYAKRFFGDIPIVRLKPLQIETALNQLREHGGKITASYPAGRPLAAKTVREVAAVVNATFNAAVRWGIVDLNPMRRVTLPRMERVEPKVLEKAQIDWFVSGVEGHEWLPVFLLVSAATGCRRGELLALTWEDVDFDSATLTISKSLAQTKAKGVFLKLPKGRKLRRFSLPESTLTGLKKHRSLQIATATLFGDDYHSKPSLVFANADGTFLKPDSVTAKVSLLARKLGFAKGVSLHTLRHTHGSHLLSLGVPLPTVSKRLGHANTHITASVYSHALEKDERAASDAWEKAMGGLGKPSNLV